MKFWDWLIFLVFGCLTFFYFRGFDAAPEGASAMAVPDDERKLLLFILDFHDFSCMTCLDSFLGLYQKLPFRLKISNTWGVLVVQDSEGQENNLIRIAKKKLRGFIQANQIISPILLDRHQVFKGMAEEGSCVVLFDGAQRIIHRYDFPLRGEEFEEIFEILME